MINLGQSKRKMNILEVLKENVNSLYVKYIKNDEIIEEPIFYIAGAQTLPPPLPEEEELFYIQKLSDEDNLEARQILIERNLRLVVHVCKKYSNTKVDQDDLLSIGTIGLIKGINSFKPEKGSKLSTYVSRCIDNEILMYLRSTKKLNAEVYLNEPIGKDKDDNVITLEEVLENDDKCIDDVVDTKMKIKKLYGKEYKIRATVYQGKATVGPHRTGYFGRKVSYRYESAFHQCVE